MGYFYWKIEKNDWLKKNRKICFEEIVIRISSEHVLDVVLHPNQEKYPNQMIMIINIDGYAHLVPFHAHEDGWFLKTIIPSRKYTKQYLKGE